MSVTATPSSSNPLGVINEFPILAGSRAWDIVGGANGKVYFTAQSGYVGELTTSGQLTTYAAGITSGAMPYGITLGPDGNLWFTEFETGYVGRLIPGGSVTEFANALPSGMPTSYNAIGIAATSAGLWYTEQVVQASPAPGWTPLPSGSPPKVVAVGAPVANHDVLGMLTTNGSTVSAIDIVGVTATTIPRLALGVTQSGDGHVWFSDVDALVCVNCAGNGYLTYFPVGSGLSGFSIAPGLNGTLAFNATPDALAEMSSNGSLTPVNAASNGPITSLPPTSGGLHQTVIGPDGALWFVESVGGVGRIARLTADGQHFSDYAVPSEAVPGSIAVGPDENLWFTEISSDRIGRVTTGLVPAQPTPTPTSTPTLSPPTATPSSNPYGG